MIVPYREEPSRPAAGPRLLRWKDWPASFCRTAVGAVLVGAFTLLVGGTVLSLPLLAISLFAGQTRDASITAVTVAEAGGKHTLQVAYEHEVDGVRHGGTRLESLGTASEPPPAFVVQAGEHAKLSCFRLGPYHADDLALPREHVFSRRVEALVGRAIQIAGAVLAAFFAFHTQISPWLRRRRIFREGILVEGRLTGIGARRRRKRSAFHYATTFALAYSFAGPDGKPRRGESEAVQMDGAEALRIGDAVQIVYDPADWQRSYVVEAGPYLFVTKGQPWGPTRPAVRAR